MKLVGDAVRQGQFYIQDKGNQSMSRGLKLIGLTSWGYVKNNMNLINTGGFRLEFLSISRVINHMTCYKFECSHWLKLQHSEWRANLVKDFCFR